MTEKTVVFCPKCKKSVEAKDYMDNFYLGMDSVLPRIRCKCSYRGLPISLPRDDYERLIRDSSARLRRSGARRS